MTKQTIKEASPLSLFRLVFGFQPGQTLSQFASECSSLRDDVEFVEDCRKFAIANADRP